MKKTQISLFVITALLFIATLATATQALAATSSITVTSSPFLSFNDVPDNFQIASLTVPTTDKEFTSDPAGQLASSRYLEVKDTRGCGGFNLTIQADTFTPATSPELRDGLRLVTNEDDAATGTTNAGVKYLTGFVGDQTVTAPLDVTSTTYSDPTLFTGPPFDVTVNIPAATITLLNGPLTAPTGRDGIIHIGASFYLAVPKFFPPSTNSYYTTLTYTLTDSTTGSCP